ncbi:hypothetical protein NBM05_02125 [Rothia sp. AR01]|uniref:Uncharacterized protein n=1 Tax=Rothia santali TaxID=2949643 RepID=A0A9X2HIG6_9MICC|nr:hypothetical protein [Rothia santali]MCP3424858.1 hypothetical protein [Rothia santali]
MISTLVSTGALGMVAAAFVGSTSAVHTDQVVARLDPAQAPVTPTASWKAQQTYLAGTSVAIRPDGDIAIWGYRGNGLSGTGHREVHSAAPVSTVSLPGQGADRADARRAVKVQGTSLDGFWSDNPDFTGLAALSEDGKVFTWGGNQRNSVMGRGATASGEQAWWAPGEVHLPGRVIDLASSSGAFMALLENGDVYTWGNNQGSRGLLGQGIRQSVSDRAPTRVQLPGPAHSIGAGTWSSWVILGGHRPDDATSGVYWWGWANRHTYQTSPGGDGDALTAVSPRRSQTLSAYAREGCSGPPTGPNGAQSDNCSIRSMSGHYHGNTFLLDSGRLLAWGVGPAVPTSWGVPWGARSAAEAATPTEVDLERGVRATRVVPTTDMVFALGDNGRVYQWGTRKYGAVEPDGFLASYPASAAPLKWPMRLDFLGADIESLGGSGYTPVVFRTGGDVVTWNGTTHAANNNRHAQVRNSFDWWTSTETKKRQPPTYMRLPRMERSR